MGSRVMRRPAAYAAASDGLLPTVALAGSFFVGLLLGFFFGTLSSESQELSEYLLQYLAAVGGSDRLSVSFWSVAWDLVRWPLLAFALGLTRLGAVGIPVVLLLRGFLLSHAISVFAHMLGAKGLLAALAVFGITALVACPVLFAVCCDGFQSALMRCKGKGDGVVFSRERLTVLLVCSGCLLIAIAVQWTLMPSLLSLICGRLFSL